MIRLARRKDKQTDRQTMRLTNYQNKTKTHTDRRTDEETDRLAGELLLCAYPWISLEKQQQRNSKAKRTYLCFNGDRSMIPSLVRILHFGSFSMALSDSACTSDMNWYSTQNITAYNCILPFVTVATKAIISFLAT